jgi:hypothetical protein
MSSWGWEWESIENYLNGTIENIEAGPLLNPIKSLEVKRDKNLQLRIHTQCDISSQNNFLTPLPGTVSTDKQSVKIKFIDGKVITAQGVYPVLKQETYNPSDGHKAIEEAQIDSLEGYLTSDTSTQPKFIIEWISNICSDGHPMWSDTIKDVRENSFKRTVGNKEHSINIPIQSDRGESSGRVCIQIKLDEIILYIGLHKPISGEKKKLGFIIYEGFIEEGERNKIRDSISFVLGNYIVYLGESHFCKEWRPTYFKVVSPNTMGGKAFSLYSFPMSPLTLRGSFIDNNLTSNAINKFYRKYDDYDLRHIGWLYWWACVSPSHIAASQFGATIEALIEVFETSIKKSILEKESWDLIKDKLRECISELSASEEKDILSNKIDNLNQITIRLKTKRFFELVGFTLTKKEEDAFLQRNKSAHGHKYIGDEQNIKLIKEVKVLRILCNRILLKICDAGDYYFDYHNEDASDDYPIKKIDDPILRD